MTGYKSLVTLITASSITLSGCLTTGESKTDNYETTGCVTLAAIGGLAAYGLAKDSDNKEELAAIVATIGCMAGKSLASEVEKRTVDYKDAQEAARMEIEKNQKNIDSLKRSNAEMEQYTKDLSEQIKQIENSSVSQNDKNEKLGLAKGDFELKQSQAKTTLADYKEDYADALKQHEKFKLEATPQDREKWQAELDSYQAAIDEYSEGLSTLNASGPSFNI